MSRIFFTSDSHFFHYNSIRHSNRPYSDVQEMNRTLVDNWNKRVRQEDIVYHLGDFCWKGLSQTKGILSQLKGKVTLITGNHDKESVVKAGFKEVTSYKVIKPGGSHIVLFHFPIEVWDRKHYGSIHLHGHSHGTKNSEGLLRMDVGVDCNNYAPIALEEVLDKMKYKLENENIEVKNER